MWPPTRVAAGCADGSVVRYLYDGDDLLAELDGATGQTIREYTYYPGVDQPHSVRSWPNGGATYYYATDNPGHVVGLIDGASQMAAEYHYSPWGEPESVAGSVVQPLRYMTREYEEFSGLYQVRARWYDAQQGRFVSEDPIGLAGGINPYRYANNDPINNTDPSGLCYTVTVTTWEIEWNKNGEEIRRTRIGSYSYEIGCNADAGGGGGRGSGANPRGPSMIRNTTDVCRFLNQPAVRDIASAVYAKSSQVGVEYSGWMRFHDQTVTFLWRPAGTPRGSNSGNTPTGASVYVHGHPHSGPREDQKLGAQDLAWAGYHPNESIVAVGRDTVSMLNARWPGQVACPRR